MGLIFIIKIYWTEKGGVGYLLTYIYCFFYINFLIFSIVLITVGCEDMGNVYDVGEIWFKKCETTCKCSPKGVNQCEPRCKLRPGDNKVGFLMILR